MKWETILDFALESNRIEGIFGLERGVKHGYALQKFLEKQIITLMDLQEFVAEIQPGATLRAYMGMNVRVGDHVPPSGGPLIPSRLMDILSGQEFTDPYRIHKDYEMLHPFTDGNGRSGRALWLYQMVKRGYDGKLGFLHMWYYQSLDDGRK